MICITKHLTVLKHDVQAELEGHDDEGRSRGSSASSSPRYSSAVLSHLAASMAASNRHAMQSPVGARGLPRFAGGGAQQYGAGHQQQPVYGFGASQQQQQQHGRASHLGAGQDGSRMMGASPGYLPTPHVPQGYAGPPVPTDGYGVVGSHQGAFQSAVLHMCICAQLSEHPSTPCCTHRDLTDLRGVLT